MEYGMGWMRRNAVRRSGGGGTEGGDEGQATGSRGGGGGGGEGSRRVVQERVDCLRGRSGGGPEFGGRQGLPGKRIRRGGLAAVRQAAVAQSGEHAAGFAGVQGCRQKIQGLR
ncbi:hypothetical protein B1218_36780, partial [Pseudomonas ogarae]